MDRGLFGQPIFTKTEQEVKHNVKVKFYPDGRNKMMVATRPIFLEPDYEAVNNVDWKTKWKAKRYETLLETSRKIQAELRWQEICEHDAAKIVHLQAELKEITVEMSQLNKKVSKPKNMQNEVRGDNVRRAMQTVFDISRLNHFKWFITWTLDKNEIDRYDKSEISKKLKVFLNNKMKRNAAIYLIIPEYHKDGAIHMHGLLAGNFNMVDSGKKTDNGQTIYNMPDWKLGFSTAIKLDENVGAISRYITKYISKDFRKIFGSFYYAGGHGLNRKPPTALYDMDYNEVNAKEYTKFGTGYKYVELGDYTDEELAEMMDRIVSYNLSEDDFNNESE